ncbi:MAG: ISAs1 family transposase [Smithella sp.]
MLQRRAHYHFTVKGNQRRLLEDLTLLFQDRGEPDYTQCTPPDHGRIEIRKIWVSSDLNDYLDFPHVGQAFVIEREVINKKTGKRTREVAYGLTSRTTCEATPKRLLEINRGHWAIEKSCHYILDWNFDEDRSRIRTGHGPENISRLRRFAIGLLKSKKTKSVAQKMRQLNRDIRLVFDDLCMTKNACSSLTWRENKFTVRLSYRLDSPFNL